MRELIIDGITVEVHKEQVADSKNVLKGFLELFISELISKKEEEINNKLIMKE